MIAASTFPPSRAAGLKRLETFLPRAGSDYRSSRNIDAGPRDHTNVSGLSPYTRTRLVTEQEIVTRVLDRHAPSTAEKFIQEVFWRTYWKGWLEMRPGVWTDYLAELERDRDRLRRAKDLEQAMAGATGIPCFDTWAQELVATGYLHNHARMWFASIWIFTLRLPWTLGADFFLRNLLDGDPAANTLGWRWVAGLQTRGKHYVAREANILKYTGGRFSPGMGLNEHPEPLESEAPLPKPHLEDLPDATDAASLAGPVGLLVTEDDLAVDGANALAGHPFDAVAVAFPGEVYRQSQVAAHVVSFRLAALDDASARLATRCSCEPRLLAQETNSTAEAIAAWAAEHKLQTVVWFQPMAGLWDGVRPEITRLLAQCGITPVALRRQWDNQLFPHATKGFFAFKKAIPGMVRDLQNQQLALPGMR